jgi:DNA-binding response OmpR family regulator
MSVFPGKSTILVIGDDDRLAYLLKRYAEQGGGLMICNDSIPSISEIEQLGPVAIIFLSIEGLQAAQSLMEALSIHDIAILVCASAADEVYARELGADACLLHPLTYNNFWAVLSDICPSE